MTRPVPWRDAVSGRLAAIRSQGRWRQPRTFDALGPSGMLTDPCAPQPGDSAGEGAPAHMVSFASNDYLGLTHHPAVVAAAHAALDRWGTGSGASRLVVGNRPIHDELEAALAAWKQTERAVVFPTGFAANLGVLTTLAGAAPEGPRPLLCSDSLNHASLIDGARLARAEVAVYPHSNLDALAVLLANARAHRQPSMVVTDTVFSMDGDAADVDALASLCAEFGAALVLDEAHAVFGPTITSAPPRGNTAQPPIIRVGTLSKMLGSLGGFVAADTDIADLLVNAARSYIFTTALSPADTAAALAAVEVMRGPEGDELIGRLRRHVDRLLPGHPSPIIPIVLGAEDHAVEVSRRLAARGLLVPAIRPPTVAPGTSRLRVTLSAAHTDAQVDSLIEALDDLGALP